ncbi:hypothetical protein FDZ73_23110 [bacterium]|nr:MAG: hypothetical protein FDZ73_23110 [bacterium]
MKMVCWDIGVAEDATVGVFHGPLLRLLLGILGKTEKVTAVATAAIDKSKITKKMGLFLKFPIGHSWQGKIRFQDDNNPEPS